MSKTSAFYKPEVKSSKENQHREKKQFDEKKTTMKQLVLRKIILGRVASPFDTPLPFRKTSGCHQEALID